jgi:oligopeptide/dipeptide ABC transporter ATP-binding protein
MSENSLLRVQDLRLYYRTTRGVVQAVDGVSFALGRRQALAVIGESGCGKTSLARAILRLLPRNVHTYTGHVFLNGADLMSLDEERFRLEVRWSSISLVAQAAMNSLNPVLKVGEQVMEPLVTHRHAGRQEARQLAGEVLRLVGLPVDFLNRYAFELSGGMRQRAVIAMALVASPHLVILDEPTSALDVLTQANVMNVLKRIKEQAGTSFILITHDIATSSELADRVAVMYAGQSVEMSDAASFFSQPLHPYSQKLMASVPRLRGEKKLEFIAGQPPSLISPPKGCRFAPRCPFRFDRCKEDPLLVEAESGRWVKCWLYSERGDKGSRAS